MTRLPTLDPAVAEIRRAVRLTLREFAEHSHPLVLVALSGGADSLALAAAAAFEAPKQGLRCGAIIVDHGLQSGSADVATIAAAQATQLGLDPVLIRRVDVEPAAAEGPEAAARAARYRAFAVAQGETGAVAILTAHTRDDQAEQVLLAISRGSGVRALAGIPPARGALRRPLLEITRAQTEQVCAVLGLTPWQDPHNRDQSYTRVRVRHRVLPLIEAELGPGIARNLARTAALAREDADALDTMVEEMIEELVEPAEAGISVSVAALAANPAAIRNRIVRLVMRAEFGVSLTREHTLNVVSLVTNWRGQGPIHVPGATVVRNHGRIVFTATGV